MKTVILAAAAVLAAAGAAQAQRFEATPRPPGEMRAYLRGDEVNYRDVTGPPPAEGSLLERVDVAEVLDFQKSVSAERYASAEQDAELLFPRFSDALGTPLDRTRLPKTIQLLYGAVHDAALVTSAGKTGWSRLRPYQRLKLQRVCEVAKPVAPEQADVGDRSSYPSGHTTAGWTTALVLAQVAPGRKAELLDRAREYGLSRIICAAHFPTDVEAGRGVATAVFERLMLDPVFKRDLACARAEYQSVAGAGEDAPASCPAASAPHARRRAQG